jgi:hypothetical protein
MPPRRLPPARMQPGPAQQDGLDTPAQGLQQAVQLLAAFDRVPRPTTGSELPAYGSLLEAAGLAVLAAAPQMPEGERLQLLDVMARFAGAMLERIPASAGSSREEHLKPLLDSAARVRRAVLDSIQTLPPPRRGGPLTGLAEQAPYVQFGLHRADPQAGAENLFPGATVDLLAAIGRLPVEHRLEPLNALSRSLGTTTLFAQPAALQHIRTRLLQAVAELQLEVPAGYGDHLRAQVRQLAEDSFLQRNNPVYAGLWGFIDRVDRWTARRP